MFRRFVPCAPGIAADGKCSTFGVTQTARSDLDCDTRSSRAGPAAAPWASPQRDIQVRRHEAPKPTCPFLSRGSVREFSARGVVYSPGYQAVDAQLCLNVPWVEQFELHHTQPRGSVSVRVDCSATSTAPGWLRKHPLRHAAENVRSLLRLFSRVGNRDNFPDLSRRVLAVCASTRKTLGLQSLHSLCHPPPPARAAATERRRKKTKKNRCEQRSMEEQHENDYNTESWVGECFATKADQATE